MSKATATIIRDLCSRLSRTDVATAATLVTALTLVTPLCGYLFQCGCTWPWSGLDAACNSHDPASPQQCPWCASLIAGWLSTVIAISAGLAAAIALRTVPSAGKAASTIVRVLVGVAVFCAVAFVAGGVSAKTQHYPIGIFADKG